MDPLRCYPVSSSIPLTDGVSGTWIDRLQERKPIREIVLDMDSSVSQTRDQNTENLIVGPRGAR